MVLRNNVQGPDYSSCHKECIEDVNDLYACTISCASSCLCLVLRFMMTSWHTSIWLTLMISLLYSVDKERVDQSEILTLESIRHSLIRQEDTIIFNLLERALYCYNADTYDQNASFMDGFHGSLVEFMVRETEKLHAQVSHTLKRKLTVVELFYHSPFDMLITFEYRLVGTRAQMSILSFQMVCLSPCCHLCDIQR